MRGVSRGSKSQAGSGERALPPAARRALLALTLLLAGLYALTAKGYVEIADTGFSVQSARALYRQGTLAIEPGFGTLAGPDGRHYSRYGPALPLLYLPLIALGEGAGAATGLDPALVSDFLVSLANAPWGALCCALLALLALRWGASLEQACGLAVLLGLGTVLWRYATCDFNEALQACLLLGAYAGLTADPSRRGPALGASLAMGALLACKVVFVLYLPLGLLYAALQPARRRQLPLLAIGPVLGLVFVLGMNALRFGSPFETGYGQSAAGFGLSALPRNLWLLTLSSEAGMFVYSPILALGLAGWPRFFRRRPREAALAAALIALNLLVAASWSSPTGGWSWGPRLLVPALPLWLLPALYAWPRQDRVAARRGLAALSLASLLVAGIGALQTTQEYHHLRFTAAPAEVRDELPGDVLGVSLILSKKLRGQGGRYPLRDFGVDSPAVVDTGAFESFQGLNLWTSHAARKLRRPALAWLPLLCAPWLLLLLLPYRRALGKD